MQIVFCTKSINAATIPNVKRVMIHPKAEGGSGTIGVYDDQGHCLGLILLDTVDTIVCYDDPNLSPELALLLPAPITKEDG